MATTEVGSALTSNILETVAEAEGVQPTQLTVPLFKSVDPDALEALFANQNNTTGRVTFDYHGYTVTVRSDGTIDLLEKYEVNQ